MAEGVDTIARLTFTKERQPQAMPKLSYRQPSQPSQRDHTPIYLHSTQDQGLGTDGRRTSRFYTPSPLKKKSETELTACVLKKKKKKKKEPTSSLVHRNQLVAEKSFLCFCTVCTKQYKNKRISLKICILSFFV